jgi:hypothetical protein
MFTYIFTGLFVVLGVLVIILSFMAKTEGGHPKPNRPNKKDARMTFYVTDCAKNKCRNATKPGSVTCLCAAYEQGERDERN